MSWKNVKDHYRITHHVHIIEGVIVIGSGYVSDLIRVKFDGSVSWGKLGPGGNDDLDRYYAEMTADKAKLRELIEAVDTFERSLPVYTYDGGEIILKVCEEYGWPNVTHDGDMMYENSFFKTQEEAVAKAKANALARIDTGGDMMKRATTELTKAGAYTSQAAADLNKLTEDYP